MGTFVSAFVVGFMAIYAAPFSLNPVTFVRDVLFYLVAALFLFCVLVPRFFCGRLLGLLGFMCFLLGLCFGWILDWVEGGGRLGLSWV